MYSRQGGGVTRRPDGIERLLRGALLLRPRAQRLRPPVCTDEPVSLHPEASAFGRVPARTVCARLDTDSSIGSRQGAWKLPLELRPDAEGTLAKVPRVGREGVAFDMEGARRRRLVACHFAGSPFLAE